MYHITLSILLSILTALSSFGADEPEPSACASPEFAQFDFWIGQWDLTWADSGRGTNTITKEYSGCVIVEKFDGRPTTPFEGMSVSTFNTRLGKWQQTWVDNSGSYLEFVGEFSGGKMILSREAMVDGAPQWQRMVWYNIRDNSLDWNWEKSVDGGKTWEVAWMIHYQRQH